MKLQIWGFLIIFLVLGINAQPKYWELKQGELTVMTKKADIIAIGKFTEKNNGLLKVKFSEILQGPQRIKKTISIKSNRALKENRNYIFFLKNQGKYYVPLPYQSILKNDMFLISRVKNEVMKWRVERSDLIVTASVINVKEIKMRDESYFVKAYCKPEKTFKGEKKKNFFVTYKRFTKAGISTVFLFEDMTYIFFLRSGKKAYELINPYEGAYPNRLYITKTLRLVTNIENKYDQAAGKTNNGARIIARLSASSFTKKDAPMIYLIIQNDSSNTMEMYHNNIPYFLLIHIFDEEGKIVPVKYPRKNSIPPIFKRYFMKLASKAYFMTSPINLHDYIRLGNGKYSIYIEYYLPNEYAGKTIGKKAWAGRVISNKIELEIKD